METGNNVSAAARSQQVYDESLTNNLSGKYHLSLQSGEDILSWCLLSVEQNKYLALETYSYSKTSEAELLAELKKSSWFSHVSSVSVAIISDKITLVPEPIFDEKAKNNYSKFNFAPDANQSALSAKVRSAGCYAVFSVAQEKEKLYRKFFPGINILHAAMPLLESILSKDKNENSEKAYINIRPKSFEIIISKGGALLFYNTFSYTTNEDVIYYLLFTFEQLKLNPENIALQLFGEVEKNDSVYSIIHKYVRNVSFGSRNDRFEYSYRFSEIPEHAFYTLFSQYLCG